MDQEVVWTERAKQDLRRTVLFIREQWTDREVQRFLFRTDRTVRYLSRYPRMFRVVSRSGQRQANIDRYNALIYRSLPGRVEIQAVWDMRQDPKRKPAR